MTISKCKYCGSKVKDGKSVDAKLLDQVADAAFCPPDVPLLQWVGMLYDTLGEANELRAKSERLNEIVRLCRDLQRPRTHPDGTFTSGWKVVPIEKILEIEKGKDKEGLIHDD